MSKSKIRSLAENSAFSAVFGGMEFRAARRAKENSPAIHRWDTIAKGKVPQGRQEYFTRRRGSKDGFLSSLRDFLRLGRLPSDESLGYFRSSLRDLDKARHQGFFDSICLATVLPCSH
jgi:hypothetical protein